MPVIVLSSPKGGAGKTTAAVILATELATTGASVTVIDADPNKNVVDWSKLPGTPENLTVIGEVSEDTIQDQIDEAARSSTFVVVDLEGTASLLVGYAIAAADLVVIPVQGSQLDAKQAARTIKLIKAQERGRAKISYAILFTRTNPAIVPRTQKHIEERMTEMEVPCFATRLADREAYRAIFSFGGTLAGLADKNMSNLPTAISNARAFAAEALQYLKQISETQSREVA